MQTRFTNKHKNFFPKAEDQGEIVSMALLLLFAFLLVFAGMSTLAAYTGFVGAVGPMRAD